MRRLCVCLLASLALHAQSADPPIAARNDVPRPGQEVLMLRHQKLKKGGHDAYLRLSRDYVWPWYEKIGSRIVGQWQVVYPDGSAAPANHDDGYRLARYASYEHWKATRPSESKFLAGDGPDYQASNRALRERNHFTLGSDGGRFLQGVTAATTPRYMPGLRETYEAAESTPEGGPRPVRNDVAWPGEEIIALDHWKVRKGSADELIEAVVRDVWPYLEKAGARAVGAWKAIYPPGSGFPESPDYDELFLMMRYAGYEHWKAASREAIVDLAGDGKDWQAYERTMSALDAQSVGKDRKFLEGCFYQSPPVFRPGLGEAYRLKR